MVEQEAKFRGRLTTALASLFVGASAGFYLLPASTHGKMSGVLRSDDGFTVIGVLIFSIMCILSTIALFSAMRAWLGWPALRYDGRVLSEYVVPFRRISASDIERIEIQSNEVHLRMKTGGKRTVNARLVKDHETFFNGINLD